jgi:hypothetical protein
VSAADSGLNMSASLASFDPATSSWRTSQTSLFADSTELLADWPRSGMTRSGRLYPLTPLVPRIDATESGLLPTPTASEGTTGDIIGQDDQFYVTGTGLPRKVNRNGKDGSVGLARLVRLLPPPRARFDSGGHRGKPDSLHSLMKYATPQARDFRTGQAERWENPNRSRNLNDQAGGKLSVIFVEWLMGYPRGWTALDHSEIQSSRKLLNTSAGKSSKRKRKG